MIDRRHRRSITRRRGFNLVEVLIAMAITAWSSGISWGVAMPPLALAVVLYGLFIQGFALVPLARRMNLTLPPKDPDSAFNA